MRIRDVMSRNPICAFADETVQEIAARMAQHAIGGLPVIDGSARVIGMISEGDLLHRRELHTEKRRSWWLDWLAGQEDHARDYLKQCSNMVADVMTSPGITLSLNATLNEAADLLERKQIKRVPVVDEGRLVGILSRADLIRALAIHYVPKEPLPENSSELRDRFYQELETADIAPTTQINAIVEPETIYLWGMVESDTQRDAVEALARQLPGVLGVENNLSVRPMVLMAE